MSAPTAHRPVRHAPAPHRLGTGLIGASVAYLGAAALMSLVAVSRPPARLLDDLAAFEDGLVFYRLGFVGASLLAPCIVALLVLLLAAAEVPLGSARRWIGSLLLAGYVPIATIAYTSQYVILPRLVSRDPQTAALWYFHDVDSIPYGLDLAGYALLGLAAMSLASALATRGRRWLAGWLLVMGGLSVVAFACHAAGFTTLGGVLSLISAATTVPVVVLAINEGRRLRASR